MAFAMGDVALSGYRTGSLALLVPTFFSPGSGDDYDDAPGFRMPWKS